MISLKEFLESRQCEKQSEFWSFVNDEDILDFAKMHVQEALEFASHKVELSPELHDFIADSWESGEWFDKKTILNAYPLNKIQ